MLCLILLFVWFKLLRKNQIGSSKMIGNIWKSLDIMIIYIYAFSRRLYPKGHSRIGKAIKRFIAWMQQFRKCLNSILSYFCANLFFNAIYLIYIIPYGFAVVFVYTSQQTSHVGSLFKNHGKVFHWSLLFSFSECFSYFSLYIFFVS